MIIPRFIAHRGANRLAPENTLKAFKLAEHSGAKKFECDVLLSQDEVPLIFHDDTLERCTNGQGLIRETPFSTLKTLDAGEGEPIPTLTQLLSWFQDSKMLMNLELKYPHHHAPPEPLVEKVCTQIAPFQNRILISSFNLEALYTVRDALPEIKIGLLIDQETHHKLGLSGIADYYKKLNAFSIHYDQHLLNPQTIKKLLKITPHLLVYTVNDLKTAKILFEQGAHAIFTDEITHIYSEALSSH
ncbi:MAG: glycerophosphodiester phosphodiesterase family protein [Gammaproteobacteria bacterium]|nr:glycerophosphodiester phosphodiesterase family protein [Gammaproteobacteria bacterium]